MIQWRKSSHSDTQAQGECVEVSVNASDVTLLRDSKNQDGPRLGVSGREFAMLLADIKSGKYDL